MKSIYSENPSGKVYVQGKASGKYPCNQVEFTVEFRRTDTSAAKASSEVTSQCERFLRRLSEAGVDITGILLVEDSITSASYDTDDTMRVTRELQFVTTALASTNNLLLKIIQEEHLDVRLSTKYGLSNEDDLRQALRVKAVEDSRATARLLAEADGYSISGIDSINIDHRAKSQHLARGVAVGSCQEELMSLSQRLSAPTKELDEEVDVIWLLAPKN